MQLVSIETEEELHEISRALGSAIPKQGIMIQYFIITKIIKFAF
jgi:hypothetical protein